MKILVAHNFYGSSAPSGENQVVRDEVALLTRMNHDVQTFYKFSDTLLDKSIIGTILGAASVPWNPFAAHEMKCTIESFRPAVVHSHNTFPLISPSIFSKIGSRSARVLTLHNYRLFCPAAIPMRNGRVCTECIDAHTVVPALNHGCYRNSRLATLPLAGGVELHRWLGTWNRHVDAFITLSEFQRDRLVRAGLPSSKVHVKPNFYPGHPLVKPWNCRSLQVVFVGRLSAEKGLRTLIEAWALWGKSAPYLRLIGDGPLRSELQAQAAGLNVTFLGHLPPEQAQAEIACAQMLVLPSECFEGFPMVIREAFALGTPAAVSNLGPLPSIVQSGSNGVVFEASNATSLLETLRAVWAQPDLLEKLGQGARLAFEAHYNEDANYQTLMEIYEHAMAENRRGNI